MFVSRLELLQQYIVYVESVQHTLNNCFGGDQSMALEDYIELYFNVAAQ